MLCLSPMPLNRRPKVPNLPDPHRARPPAKRVRSPVGKRQKLRFRWLGVFDIGRATLDQQRGQEAQVDRIRPMFAPSDRSKRGLSSFRSGRPAPIAQVRA
jgi:hypothetical protein